MQETSPGPSEGKTEWRQWLRKALAAIAEPEAQSKAIRQQLNELLSTRPASSIATFAALKDEPSIIELIPSFPDHRWLLPRVVDDKLVFHRIDRLEQLKRGAFGIAEPTTDLPTVSASEIDCFLCPGLGFDRNRNRLGRGKGFYDRALASARGDALRIGIAFREQVVDKLPADPHDIPMTSVISENGRQC